MENLEKWGAPQRGPRVQWIFAFFRNGTGENWDTCQELNNMCYLTVSPRDSPFCGRVSVLPLFHIIFY